MPPHDGAIEASNTVEQAIVSTMHMAKGYEEGDILLDWALVAYIANPDREKGGGIQTLYPNGEIPHYRARGLFHAGLESLNPIFDVLEGDEE